MYKASYGRDEYDIIDTPTFEDAFERFLKDYDGVNVTMPYKVDAYLKADRVNESAAAVRAANVLLKGPEGLEVYNTDYTAVKRILQEKGVSGRALVVGFGGAGKAAAKAAATLCDEVFVANRTLSTVQDYFAQDPDAKRFKVISLEDISSVLPQVSCVVDALKVPVPALEDLSNLQKGAVVLEANYMHPNISESDTYDYVGGRLWLLYQAVEGFRLLTGTPPNIIAMSSFLGIK